LRYAARTVEVRHPWPRVLAAALVALAGATRVRAQDGEAGPVIVRPEPLELPAIEPWPALPDGTRLVLRLTVLEDGVPADVVVEEGPEDAALRARAVGYVEGLRFTPATVDGTPRAVAFRFQLLIPAVHRPESPLPPPPEVPAADAVEPEVIAPAPSEGEPSDAAAAVGAEAPDPPLDEGGAAEMPAFRATAEGENRLDSRESTAVSDLHIEVGLLSEVPRDGAQDLITLAPGVLLNQVQNQGHAAAMFLRGFDAEEGEDVEILLQGIPLNEVSSAHGHGYADALSIMPQLVRSVRVIQGPFDPAQGDFAVAGSAEYSLGARERGLHGEAGYGLYGQRRLAMWWAPRGQREGTFAGFAYNGSDGWGVNRRYDNLVANLQYEARLLGRTTLKLLAFGHLGTWQQAGVLREDDFEQRRIAGCAPDADAQFFCTYDPRQGGYTSRLGLSGELLHRDGPQRFRLLVFGMVRSFRVQENFTGFNIFNDDEPAERVGDLADQQYEATTLGLRGTYRRSFELLEQAQRVEVGLYARQDLARTTLARLRDPSIAGGAGWGFDFDRDLSVTNVGAHLRFDLRFTDWLRLMVGARADGFGFRFTDLDRPAVDERGLRIPEETNDAFGFLVQPRGALTVALHEHLEWTTSLGIGARSTDGAALSEGEAAPFAEVVAAETGLALSVGELGDDVHLTGGLSAFFTRVSQDLVFDAERGRNTLTGPSNRLGATAFARLQLERWFDTQLAVTTTRAHLPRPEDGFFDVFAGPRLPFIPEWLVRLDSAVSRPFELGGVPLRGSVAVGALYLGPRPLPFEERSERWFVLDLAARLRWQALELGVVAKNLLDLRYRAAEFQYASNFDGLGAPPSLQPARHFAAGAPLQILVTFAVHVPLLDAPGSAPETGASASTSTP
jgi:iron complex outermembrane receptor protein